MKARYYSVATAAICGGIDSHVGESAVLQGLRSVTVRVTATFNTHVARHRFCKHCGIHAFYVPRSDPDKVEVNARCLEGVDPSVLPIAPFDGRNRETAIEQSAPWRET